MIKVHTNLFTRVPNAALDDPSLSRADVMVLTAICRRMNNETLVATGVSYEYLVKSSGSGKTTVCKSINTLIEKGYLKKTVGKGFKQSNTYTVVFDVTYEVEDTSYTGQCVQNTLASDQGDGEIPAHEGAKDALDAFVNKTGEVTMHEVSGKKRHWTVSAKQDTPRTNNCDTVETPKEETKVVRKPIKRDVSVKQDTPTVKKKLTRTGKQKPAEKPIFTRGYAASPTPLPPRGADVTAWSGYDGTALAERDGVRGKLKAGKRIYTILGKKYTFVMQDDGETVNFMASEPTANMLKYDVLKYLKVPDYRRDQWKTIIDTLRRN